MTSNSEKLLAALKRHFGYHSFRPLQEEIVSAALAGDDVLALLPTGGGKSLCFQLPAVVQEGLTVVISPLIALMKDQVDGLEESGVPATFLNSAIDPQESRARYRGLYAGEYKLLYVAPERLMMDNFLEVVRSWNVQLIAIDEAHCVSEWGHDFRPEYRALSALRDAFPKVPIMALTATATERVREDIAQVLRLRAPKRFVASFNRPNLLYRVLPKAQPLKQIVEFIGEHPGESGIVYCFSRRSAESVAEHLNAAGIKALPYHAGLDPKTRARTQESFIRDELPIITATIAFGMGIDKPNVRFVIHHDLPKNMESYYQETGRAGRDGLPSECLLLFSSSDVAKILQFIEEKPDDNERALARTQLFGMVEFAESAECRRVALLRYFGENYCDAAGAPLAECGSCDNCLTPRERFDGAAIAQKFLSCVYRIRQRSGFGVGINHVVEVLTGADTEKVRKWGHDKISTYAIGKEHSRNEWLAFGRELLREGFLRQNAERFSTLEITDSGRELLRTRGPLLLTKPIVSARLGSEKRRKASAKSGALECNEQLFERLRALRKKIADSRDVPAYIVFPDVTLRHMAARMPSNNVELLEISGVGEKKLAQYGAEFLQEIAEYRRAQS